MSSSHENGARDVTADERHAELLGRNVFIAIVMGAAGFITACLVVMLH